MYQRYDGSGKNQWAPVAFDQDPSEQQNAIVFVHGWRMSPEGASNFAETFYKRLWQRGFKGRFAAFRWDTHWSDQYGWVPYAGEAIDAYLAQYNDSEHNAWLAGVSLASFINNLPVEYSKHVAAHSMGNVVAGAALLAGANIQNYALMQAAVPAACYDESASIKQTAQYDHHTGLLTFTMWDNLTPDEDSDPAVKAVAYRGRLKNVAGNLINFYLPEDYARIPTIAHRVPIFLQQAPRQASYYRRSVTKTDQLSLSPDESTAGPTNATTNPRIAITNISPWSFL